MKISNLSYKNILNMKTQAKNTLAFINIALLLLFFFGISSCSALQIGKDIKTQLFQENGNVFYISSTYAKREIVWSYTNDKNHYLRNNQKR